MNKKLSIQIEWKVVFETSDFCHLPSSLIPQTSYKQDRFQALPFQPHHLLSPEKDGRCDEEGEVLYYLW